MILHCMKDLYNWIVFISSNGLLTGPKYELRNHYMLLHYFDEISSWSWSMLEQISTCFWRLHLWYWKISSTEHKTLQVKWVQVKGVGTSPKTNSSCTVLYGEDTRTMNTNTFSAPFLYHTISGLLHNKTLALFAFRCSRLQWQKHRRCICG